MHPIICTFGPFTVFSYGLMLAIAFMVSSTLAASYAEKKGIAADAVYNVTLLSFVSGILGARIFYILQNLAYYRANPREMLMFSHGGLAWFGGLIAGTVAAITYIKVKKLSLYALLDCLAPFIALGQAIGRIGCLLNGCCYGKESGFGFHFPTLGVTLIPTQAYSTLALLVIFVLLRRLQAKGFPTGVVFYSYLLLYAAKRFIIEFWRGDNPPVWGSLTLFQVLSILVFIIAAVQLRRLKKN